MFQLSKHEYILKVRPGSNLLNFEPGYLYIYGNVSSFMVRNLETLEKQMMQLLSDNGSLKGCSSGDEKYKEVMSIWNKRMVMAVTMCRSAGFEFSKVDAWWLRLYRQRSYVVGRPYVYLVPGCSWLYTFGDFGEAYKFLEIAIVFYGDMTSRFREWVYRVEKRFREVEQSDGKDSEVYYEAVFSVIDAAYSSFGVDAVILPVCELGWLKDHAVFSDV